ncbi:MAG: polysaccharide deacetylase family protein [Chthoniobacteraceae bacterium]
MKLPPALFPILFATAFATGASVAETPTARIANFDGDRLAAISYTFDDNLRDQYTVGLPMLDAVGFKGTFFVIAGATTDTVEEAEKKQSLKRAWGSICWPELKKIAEDGQEIGSHTWSHPNLRNLPPAEVEAQFSKANDAIKQHLGITPITLAFPFNASTPGVQKIADKYYVAYRTFQVATSAKSTAASLNAWADKLVTEKKWGVMMTHAVGTGYSALTDPEIFRTHLQYVKSHAQDFWVDTFANVARYQKERDDAKLAVTPTAGGMTCLLTGTLDPKLYNVPLTIVIDEKAATAVHATRGGRELPVREENGFIKVQAAPAPEPVTVTWQ